MGAQRVVGAATVVVGGGGQGVRVVEAMRVVVTAGLQEGSWVRHTQDQSLTIADLPSGCDWSNGASGCDWGNGARGP
jgi:hypothetical protein